MDVKQIREEITKIEALLAGVDADIAALKSAIQTESDSAAIEAEYMVMLQSLALGSSHSRPFQSMEDEDVAQASEMAPDAFTFFGLLQAFIGDPNPVLLCLSKILVNVPNVTSTQLGEAVKLVAENPQLEQFGKIKYLLLLALFEKSLLEVKKLNPDIIGEICALIEECGGLDEECDKVRSLAVSAGLANIAEWPLHVHVELCFLLRSFAPASLYIQATLGVVAETVQNETLMEVGLLWKFLALSGTAVTELVPSLGTYLESNINKIGVGKNPSSDFPKLVLLLHQVGMQLSQTVWMSLTEKLSVLVNPFEIAGLPDVLRIHKVAADSFFSDPAAFKKCVASADVNWFLETVNYLLLVGDKSIQHAFTKSLLERRDLFVSQPETVDTANMELLIKVLLLCVMASVESETVIPEAILLLKKHAKFLLDFVACNQSYVENTAILFALLLPSHTAELAQLAAISISTHSPSAECVSKICKTLFQLGISIDGVIAKSEHAVDNLFFADICFPSHQIVIVLDVNCVTNVITKKTSNSAMISLKQHLLTKRGCKVVVVRPDICADEKSALMNLLSEPLSAVPPNSSISFFPNTDLKLSANQRVGTLFVRNPSAVEVAKFLFLILRHQIQVHAFDFAPRVSKELIPLIFAEFFPTFLVKHKFAVTVKGLSGELIAEHLPKIVEALGATVAAAGDIGPFRLLGVNLSVEDANAVKSTALITVVLGECPSDWDNEQKFRNTLFIG